MKKASEICFSEVFTMIPVSLLIEWERSVTHTRRGCDGREEGCECGYYDLHRDLNETLFHASPPFRLVLVEAVAAIAAATVAVTVAGTAAVA